MLSVRFSGFMVGALVATTAHALDVDPVNSGMGEERLAPVMAVSGTEASATLAVKPIKAEPATPADPFTVQNVDVSLEGTTGFDRDAALEKGARQSLPEVLVNMGMPVDKATTAVKNLGSAMRFVKGYKIVKESLIPHYQLTADITFNEPMLTKNFGTALPPKTAPVTVTGEADVVAPVVVPTRTWIVKITDNNPASVDKVRVNLNKLDNTTAMYRLLTSDTAELLVESPLEEQALQRAAGPNVRIVALGAVVEPAATPSTMPVATTNMPMDMPVVQVQPELRPWQGRDDRGTPMDVEERSRPWFPWGR